LNREVYKYISARYSIVLLCIIIIGLLA